MLKNKIRKAFDVNAQMLKETIEENEEKSREATEKLEEFHNKIKNVHAVIDGIRQTHEEELRDFQQRQSIETKDKIHRIKIEAQSKLEQEERIIERKLQVELTELDSCLCNTSSASCPKK